ncbi:MAG: YggT family protein [Gammaproteobacteria bacterium]
MMGGGYVSNAGVFLVNTLFGLYIGAVMLRLLLQLTRADFYNPLSQAIVRLTNPVLRPLRRYIPAVGKIDSASVLLMVVLQIVNVWIVGAMLGLRLGLPALLVATVGELLSKFVYLYMFAIIIQAVASWVAPGSYNPVLGLIGSVTEPLLRPIRRILPNLGGLDLSPLVAIVLLQLVLMLVVAPLGGLARPF